MVNNKIYYDKKSDSLYLLIKKGEEDRVEEVSPGVNVELGKNGELMGIEILNASSSVGKLMSAEKSSGEKQNFSST